MTIPSSVARATELFYLGCNGNNHTPDDLAFTFDHVVETADGLRKGYRDS